MILCSFLFIGYSINTTFEHITDIEKDKSLGVPDEYTNILSLSLNVDMIFWSIFVILSFLLIIGTYYIKKWAWIGMLMICFYSIFGHIIGIVSKTVMYTVLSLDYYPYFNLLNLVFNILFVVLFSIMLYLLFKPEVKSYFKITY